MAKSKQAPKGPSSRAVLTLLILGILGLGAIAAYVKLTPADRIPDSLRAHESAPTRTTKEHTRVKIVDPHASGPNIDYGQHDAPVPNDGDAVLTAVNGFLDQVPSVPKDARALSADVKDGIAKIQFANSFERSYGSTDEGAILQGLQRAMGQFKDVKKFYLEIGGRAIDSLGNVDISEGIEVIRAGKSAPTTSGEAQP